jgi:hypothetical protein
VGDSANLPGAVHFESVIENSLARPNDQLGKETLNVCQNSKWDGDSPQPPPTILLLSPTAVENAVRLAIWEVDRGRK